MKSSILTRTLLTAVVVGLVCGMIPADAFARGRHKTVVVTPRREVVVVKGNRYDYHGGRFYKHGPRGYAVVRPPYGAVIRVLPPRCRFVFHRGVRYYYYDDIYYRDCAGGFVVVPRPSLFSFSFNFD